MQRCNSENQRKQTYMEIKETMQVESVDQTTTKNSTKGVLVTMREAPKDVPSLSRIEIRIENPKGPLNVGDRFDVVVNSL